MKKYYWNPSLILRLKSMNFTKICFEISKKNLKQKLNFYIVFLYGVLHRFREPHVTSSRLK